MAVNVFWKELDKKFYDPKERKYIFNDITLTTKKKFIDNYFIYGFYLQGLQRNHKNNKKSQRTFEPYICNLKDYYGNKELVPGAKSLLMLDNIIKQLNMLPPVYRDFYARRVADKVQASCCNK